MKPDEFIRLHLQGWLQLSTLASRARFGLRKLSVTELRNLSDGYRAAANHLGIAQRDFPDHPVASYLNRLVAQTYPVVYAERGPIWPRLRAFYTRELPRLFRSMGGYILAGNLLFYGPAVVLFLLTLVNPDAADLVISPELRERIASGNEWWRSLNEANQIGAAAIMTNNLRVALMAFAGGISFGLFTLYITVLNGLHLGGVFGLAAAIGNPWPLAEFVVGHGVLELNEIVFASASGLMMGHAMLQPGLHTRSTALMLAARKAVRLLAGTAPLLVVAGLFEGFVSPSFDVPAVFKYGFGLLSGLLLYAWLIFAGRGGDRAPAALLAQPDLAGVDAPKGGA